VDVAGKISLGEFARQTDGLAVKIQLPALPDFNAGI
jgi:hypothetical protein